MIYVLERDGIAACPDDPLRVAAPEGLTRAEERELDRRRDAAFCDIYDGVMAVLRGDKTTAKVGHETYDAGELYEMITGDEESADLASMLLGVGRHKLVEKWCFYMAGRIAS